MAANRSQERPSAQDGLTEPRVTPEPQATPAPAKEAAPAVEAVVDVEGADVEEVRSGTGRTLGPQEADPRVAARADLSASIRAAREDLEGLESAEGSDATPAQ